MSRGRAVAAGRSSRWLWLAAALAAAGCDGGSAPRLADYLDELSVDMPLETATYVSLGEFHIPVAAASEHHDVESGPAPVPMTLGFELVAETLPRHEKAVESSAALRRGALSDAVLTVVRTSTLEELTDPKLSAVKARLTDVARPLLGDDLVRQLVLNELDQESTAKSESGSGGGHGGEHQKEKEPAHGGGHH